MICGKKDELVPMEYITELNNKLSRLINNKESLIKCKKKSKQIGFNYSIEKQFKKIVYLIDNI